MCLFNLYCNHFSLTESYSSGFCEVGPTDLDNVIVARLRVIDTYWPLRCAHAPEDKDDVHVYIILQIEIQLHILSCILGQMQTVAAVAPL